MKINASFLMLVLVILLAEAALIGRVWVQATTPAMAASWQPTLLTVTDVLAEPFVLVTGRPPLSQPGVIDFTVLVAIEGYFAGLVALLIAAGAARLAVRGVLGLLPARLPDFAVRQMDETAGRKIWQPVPSARRRGLGCYTARVRPRRPPNRGDPLGGAGGY